MIRSGRSWFCSHNSIRPGILDDTPPFKKFGFGWNRKRIYRIYKSMKLNLRNKRKKRLPARVKEPLLRPIYPNVTWSMDFMHDTLENGKSVRSLNIIDDFNREILNITLDTSLPSGKSSFPIGIADRLAGKVRKDKG